MSGSAPTSSSPAAEGEASASPAVTIAIARDPALVRTVRLVSAAVARRAQVDETLIEEIRLAVGEACAVMIGPDVAADPADDADLVVVRISAGPGAAVEAVVEGRVGGLSQDLVGLDLDPWALLQGLSDAVTVDGGADRTRVQMVWNAA